MYRIPNSSNVAKFLKSFTTWLDIVQTYFKNILIMGDFNIHFCKLDSEAKAFLNITNSFGIKREYFHLYKNKFEK